MKRSWGWIVAGLFLSVGVAHLSFGLQPPTREQVEQYQQDGTWESRVEQAKAIGNHHYSENLAYKFRQKLKQLKAASASGLAAQVEEDLTILSPPPAWQFGLPSKGTPKVFVLLVDFPDAPHYANQTKIDVESKFFGNGDSSLSPYESLRNYYQRSSYNQLTIGGTVFEWYTAQNNRVYYETAGSRALITEAIDHFNALGHDFTQYDNDGDGTIDGFFIKWTGDIGAWASFWWAYMTTWPSTSSYRVDGKQLGPYVWSWIADYEGDPYTAQVDIHETGHLLGLPDLYDYDGGVGPDGGVGGLDMMDHNWGDHNCFSKYMLDWLEPTVVGIGKKELDLSPSGTSKDCVLIMPDAADGDMFGEFFMAQYRKSNSGNDPGSYPADGLVIWHIDSTLNSSGYDFLYDNSYTAHKMVKLVQADGLGEIEQGVSADEGDFYAAGDEFGPESTPNSKNYANADTNVQVDNIGSPGTTMHADFTILGTVLSVYDMTDLELLLEWWLSDECLDMDYCDGADYTQDGRVNLVDFVYLTERWQLEKPPERMVLLPENDFQMGDTFGEGSSNELPVHSVLVNDFHIGQFEVTNDQYCDYLNDAWANGLLAYNNGVISKYNDVTYVYCDTIYSNVFSQIYYSGSWFYSAPEKENHPVVMVSWYGAAAYCNWLSEQNHRSKCYSTTDYTPILNKHGYRLPTEAEWEFAARGGLSGKRYPCGDSVSSSQANYMYSHDPYESGSWPWTTPVGFFDGTLQDQGDFEWPGDAEFYQTVCNRNAFGLYDMQGNVWEWCNDWFSDTYYSTSPYDNPTGPTTGTAHVIRGGDWSSNALYMRVSKRASGVPATRYFFVGFRVVQSPL